MKHPYLILLIVLLAGCFPDAKRDLDTCELEAMRMSGGESPRNLGDRSTRYIEKCMEVKGWELRLGKAECMIDKPVSGQVGCFVRAGGF